MSNSTYFWLLLAGLLFFLESQTAALVSIWFALGSTAALVVSLFLPSITFQFEVFVLVSAVCLVLSRPLAHRLRSKPTPTNGDRNIGRTATVLTPVSSLSVGRVRLDGVDWNARCTTDISLTVGEVCRVVEIQSTLLLVEPLSVPPLELFPAVSDD